MKSKLLPARCGGRSAVGSTARAGRGHRPVRPARGRGGRPAERADPPRQHGELEPRAFTNEIAALSTTFNNLPVNDEAPQIPCRPDAVHRNRQPEQQHGRRLCPSRDPRLDDAPTRPLYANLVNSLDKSDRQSQRRQGRQDDGGGLSVFSRVGALLPATARSRPTTPATRTAQQRAASNAVYALAGNALTPSTARLTTARSSPAAAAATTSSTSATARCRTITRQHDGAPSGCGRRRGEGIAGATATIAISPSGSQSNVADEWARFMRRSTSASPATRVDVDKVTTGQGPGWTRAAQEHGAASATASISTSLPATAARRSPTRSAPSSRRSRRSTACSPRSACR